VAAVAKLWTGPAQEEKRREEGRDGEQAGGEAGPAGQKQGREDEGKEFPFLFIFQSLQIIFKSNFEFKFNFDQNQSSHK
jgi:hypothetical protein